MKRKSRVTQLYFANYFVCSVCSKYFVCEISMSLWFNDNEASIQRFYAQSFKGFVILCLACSVFNSPGTHRRLDLCSWTTLYNYINQKCDDWEKTADTAENSSWINLNAVSSTYARTHGFIQSNVRTIIVLKTLPHTLFRSMHLTSVSRLKWTHEQTSVDQHTHRSRLTENSSIFALTDTNDSRWKCDSFTRLARHHHETCTNPLCVSMRFSPGHISKLRNFVGAPAFSSSRWLYFHHIYKVQSDWQKTKTHSLIVHVYTIGQDFGHIQPATIHCRIRITKWAKTI